MAREARHFSRLRSRRFARDFRLFGGNERQHFCRLGFCRRSPRLSAKLGRARPELGEAIRSTPYKGYVIFFGYVGARFEVIAILEGHRDIDAHFSGPEDE